MNLRLCILLDALLERDWGWVSLLVVLALDFPTTKGVVHLCSVERYGTVYMTVSPGSRH